MGWLSLVGYEWRIHLERSWMIVATGWMADDWLTPARCQNVVMVIEMIIRSIGKSNKS